MNTAHTSIHIHEKNGFAKRSKIFAGYRLTKLFSIKIIM